MRLDQRIVDSEFERLRACNYFPVDEVAQKELKRALNSAPNEIIVSAVVNEWMETQTERPTPADLYRSIREKAGPAEPGFELRANPDCESCDGSGWIIVERNGLSGARRCDCWDRRPAPKLDAMALEEDLMRPTRNAPNEALTHVREIRRTHILTRLDGEGR